MSKQVHEELGAHEAIEPVAALIRQSASRAIERLRMQFTRNQANSNPNSNSSNMYPGGLDGVSAPPPPPSLLTNASAPLTAASMRKPIDIFVIQFCLYYLDTRQLPAKHYVRLAQEVVTSAVERVLVPSLFQRATSLPMLCESLVLERSADEVQVCLKEMEEFVEAREALGAWLAGLGDFGQRDDDDEAYADDWTPYDYGGDKKRHAAEGDDGWPKKEDPGDAHSDADGKSRVGRGDVTADALGGEMAAGVDVAGWLYQSLEFWLRIRGFLHAWSFSTANLHAFPLKPRYERELMTLLGSASGRSRRPAEAGVLGDGHGSSSVLPITAPPGPAPSSTSKGAAPGYTPSTSKQEPSSLVKQEKRDDDGDDDDAVVGDDILEMVYRGDDDNDDDEYNNNNGGGRGLTVSSGSLDEQQRTRDRVQHRRDVATTVLANVLALSECPVPPPLDPTSPSSNTTAAAAVATASAPSSSSSSALLLTDATRQALRGVNPTFFTMVHARLSVMVARDHLIAFSESAASVVAPQLTALQANVLQQQEAMRAQYLAYYGAGGVGAAAGRGNGEETGAAASGLPLDYVPDDQYYMRLMHKVAPEEAELGEDEELFKDEVVDYYKHKTNTSTTATATTTTAANTAATGKPGVDGKPSGNRDRPQRPSSPAAPKELIKPERFCRMGTGYRWTQYNRTHYDSHTNPPPRTVMWYKFTLLYPLLADTKRDMRNIFHIEDTPKGPNDDHCILVFSPGPPYADVAYRIVKQQWDRRRGGVSVSFDSTGRFQLFFRFSNSNYRR